MNTNNKPTYNFMEAQRERYKDGEISKKKLDKFEVDELAFNLKFDFLEKSLQDMEDLDEDIEGDSVLS